MFHNIDGTPDNFQSFSEKELKDSYEVLRQVLKKDQLIDIDSYATIKAKVDFYNKCVKHYLLAMRKIKGKRWTCDMYNGTHFLAMLLSFKGTTWIKRSKVKEIEAMYCKNLKNALEKIQQDTKQNKTYYVGPDEQLKVLLKTKKPAYKKKISHH